MSHEMRQLIESVQVSALLEGYEANIKPTYEPAIVAFMEMTRGDIRYSTYSVKAVAKKIASILHSYSDEERAELGEEAVYDMFCEQAVDALERVHHTVDKYRMEEFYNRKPDVEHSDELTFLRDEQELSKACDLFLDPTAPNGGFALFVEALNKIRERWTETYNYGFDDGVRDTLKTALPLALVLIRVATHKLAVKDVLTKYGD